MVNLNIVRAVQLEKEEMFGIETTNLISTIYAAVKMNLAPTNAEQLFNLLDKIGGRVGSKLRSREAAFKVIELIGDEMRSILIGHLTRSKHPCSLILDGPTDNTNKHYLITYIQTTEGNRTIVYCYSFITLGKDSTADSMKNALVEQFEKGETDFVNYLKQHTVGFISDSASVMIGPNAGLKQKLEQWINRPRIDGEPGYLPLFGVDCMAHITLNFKEINETSR